MIGYAKKFLRKNKGIFFLVLIANFIKFFLMLLLPRLNGYYFDMLIERPDKREIIRFGLIIAFVGLTFAILNYKFCLFKVKSQSKLTFQMFNDTICHVHKSFYWESCKYNPTYLNQRVNQDVKIVAEFLLDKITNSIFCFLNSLIIIISVSKKNVLMGVLMILILPVYVLCYLALKNPLYKRGLIVKNKQATLYNEMNEQFAFLKEIKLSGDYTISEKNRRKSFNEFLETFVIYNKISCAYDALESTVSLLFKVIALILAGYEILAGRMTIGGFTVITTYFGMLMQNTKFFFSFGKAYQNASNSFARINELLNLEIEKYGEKEISEYIYKLTIENMTFKYNEKVVLENVYIEFCKGVNLIIGINGAGKSTLLNIIVGLLKGESSGGVYYNSYNIQGLDIEKLREKKVAVYSQNQKCMSETVGHMLFVHICNDVNCIREMIYRLGAESIYLTEEFNVFQKLETNLSDLSGGEKQRMLLLPVLLKQSEVLILDEPTSDLDIVTKKELIKVLNRIKDKIIIVTTHEEYLYDDIVNINKVYI